MASGFKVDLVIAGSGQARKLDLSFATLFKSRIAFFRNREWLEVLGSSTRHFAPPH